jgi:hypothetical protein
MFRTFLIAALIGIASAAAKAEEPTTQPASAPAQSVELQVAALNTIDDLNLDADQLRAIRALLKSDSAAPATEPADKGSNAYKSVLTSLREAIISEDAGKEADSEKKLDQLRTAEHLNVAPAVAMTDFAREKSAAVLKLLRSSQIGSYLAEHGDDVPDALETILDAFDQSRGQDKAAFDAICNEASDQVSVLVGGVTNPSKSAEVMLHTAALLQNAYGMNDAQYQAGYKKLENSARRIVGRADGFTALHNWMQREIADLLSNPELPAMIDAKLANPQS